MNRRNFLSTLLASGALSASGLLNTPRVQAMPFATVSPRHLVSILLSGGPDFRFLMPPAFSEDRNTVGGNYWQQMAASHELGDSASEQAARWNNDYFHVGDGTTEFGILKTCGWLKSMWDDGNVAVVNNILGTSARNHPLGISVTEQGSHDSADPTGRAPGWGGRLADDTDSNVLSLSPFTRKFCFGADSAMPTRRSDARVISAQNTRDLSLHVNTAEDAPQNWRPSITRGVQNYYAAQNAQFANSPIAARFSLHEQKLRVFGEAIEDRLADVPEPAELKRLYDTANLPLNSPVFGLQIRNLYDSFACADILNMGIAALEYRGWDSHQIQRETMEPRLFDLFGTDQALASLYATLPTHITDHMVMVLNGEFGRQIKANGDGGTDHGEGATTLIIGKSVNGGIYGDMFPESELAEIDNPSPQIAGLTAVEQLYAPIADWFSPGAGLRLFENHSTAPLENAVDLSALFANN